MTIKQSANLYTFFASKWRDPARTVIENDNGRIISYADLDTETAKTANTLISLGLKPGDRVACRAEKSPEVIALYLACLRAGMVFLPLNPAYTISEIEFTLNDAEPALVVTDPSNSQLILNLCEKRNIPHCLTLGTNGDGSLAQLTQNHSSNFQNRTCTEDDLAAILYTSGTTGRPKGAMLSHKNLRSNAKVLTETWRFTESDVLIHALPVFHAHGLFVACNVILTAGARMIFLKRFTIDGILNALPRATTMMGVPTFYTRLLNEPHFNKKTTIHMRLFISGSAPLLAETHRAFTERTGHKILERYGMTETGMNTSNPYNGSRKPGSVGLPLKGTTIRITHPKTGQTLPQGEIGMIEVKGPNVFSGYWRQPKKTAQEFRDNGFFFTGDLGRIDDEGYIYILDRSKDLIISGGLNVYPKEVENALNSLPGVSECAVIGRKHDDLGESVIAIIVPKNDIRLDVTHISEQLDEKLARYKHPKHIILADELPRNAMGKVQKNILRELYGKASEIKNTDSS